MPFISFYDYITSRKITQEKNEKIDKKIKHFECLHQFFYFKSVKLPGKENQAFKDNKIKFDDPFVVIKEEDNGEVQTNNVE